MRVVLQRVNRAAVSVDGRVVGRIGPGLVALVAVEAGDGAADVAYAAAKTREVRIFPDETGRMNRSLEEAGGAVLVVSQFTLMGDARKGRRPSYDAAEAPARAKETYEQFVTELRRSGLTVESGVFQADMQVELVNDGPVTILLDSRRMF
jgi:D-tyrosyl-tRNA(Tyr) deacylase